jgi:hypothetical protein
LQEPVRGSSPYSFQHPQSAFRDPG